MAACNTHVYIGQDFSKTRTATNTPGERSVGDRASDFHPPPALTRIAPGCHRCPLASAGVGAFADLFHQLDTDDRIKGKQFEHICKWFLTNDPVYKHELRRVWLWNEWPGR